MSHQRRTPPLDYAVEDHVARPRRVLRTAIILGFVALGMAAAVAVILADPIARAAHDAVNSEAARW